MEGFYKKIMAFDDQTNQMADVLQELGNALLPVSRFVHKTVEIDRMFDASNIFLYFRDNIFVRAYRTLKDMPKGRKSNDIVLDYFRAERIMQKTGLIYRKLANEELTNEDYLYLAGRLKAMFYNEKFYAKVVLGQIQQLSNEGNPHARELLANYNVTAPLENQFTKEQQFDGPIPSFDIVPLLKFDDQAQSAKPQADGTVDTKGGIDLNPAQMSMQVKKEGEDFKFDFNGSEIDAAEVTGATFTIRQMTPVVNLPQVLRLNNASST